MPRLMFPYLTKDGWSDTPEPQEQGQAATRPKRRGEWVRRGFFKDKPMSRREVALKANSARLWLRATLHEGPMLAVEVLRLAAEAGVNEWSLRRAKKRLGIKAVKVGGRRQGWGAKWFWTAAKSTS